MIRAVRPCVYKRLWRRYDRVRTAVASGEEVVMDKNNSKQPRIARWGKLALPVGMFGGTVLGVVIGAMSGNPGIGLLIGAGLGVGIGVSATVAIFVFYHTEVPGSH